MAICIRALPSSLTFHVLRLFCWAAWLALLIFAGGGEEGLKLRSQVFDMPSRGSRSRNLNIVIVLSSIVSVVWLS